ncbi:MAG: hypothetical protein QXD11_02335 [Candidatus Micrarchaeaceae archaeon]
MSKKTSIKKARLGHALKQSRKIPLLATLRTHRKIQYNKFARDWRKQKLKKKIDFE